MNLPITIKEIEFLTHSVKTEATQNMYSFTEEFYIFEELIEILYIFHKMEEDNFTNLVNYCCQNKTCIVKIIMGIINHELTLKHLAQKIGK